MNSMATAQRSRSSSAAAAKACSSHVPVVVHDGGAREEEEEAEQLELRRGPWTVDEDLTLVNYIADHGEGRWNSLARAAGLKRTGKSCRLRWLNYLRPDVKRGNFTADEQLLILDLHTRWGNRWSKIAQHLPGRTDNEIKNYWRTRVQKHAKQLNCDANSKRFKDAMRYIWMPHLVDADDHRPRLLQAHHHALSSAGGMMVQAADSSSPDYSSFATSSESAAAAAYYDDGAGGLLCASLHAAEMLENDAAGDGYWAQEAMQGFWPSDSDQPAQDNHGSHHQLFPDPELTGWVQGFSEGITDNFWALEDIWKIQ